MRLIKFLRRIIGKIAHLYFEHISKDKLVCGKILMLHSVGGCSPNFNISIKSFEKLIVFIKEHHVIRLEDWKDDNNFFAITFDDVMDNFYYNSFPILQKHHCPFTIFVSLSLLDKPGYITTNQLKEVAASPLCTVGSHGILHTPFAELSNRDFKNNLKDSQKRLSDILKRKIELFAFPYGSYYACGFRRKHIVNKYYRYGFGTVQIPITMPRLLPDYYLPRINVEEYTIQKIIGK